MIDTPVFPRKESEARLRYGHGDFDILTAGTYVTCAITGIAIPLDELRYWNVERQEAYATCEASTKAELRAATLYRHKG